MKNLFLRLLGLPTAPARRRDDVEYAEDRRASRELDLDAYLRG